MLTLIARERPDGCISDLAFDEWHAGELPMAAVRELEDHLSSCARCRARRESIDASASAFLERFPTLGGLRGSTVARPKRPSRAWIWASGGVATLAAVAAGLSFYLRQAPSQDTTRLKGGPHVGFFVKRGEAIFQGGDGERVRPHDTLRFVASTAEARHLAILSLDASGAASVYYPAANPTRIFGPASSAPLDNGVELDETLGDEQIFALFCKSPIDLDAERAALERNHTVKEHSDCLIDSLRIVKEPAR